MTFLAVTGHFHKTAKIFLEIPQYFLLFCAMAEQFLGISLILQGFMQLTAAAKKKY